MRSPNFIDFGLRYRYFPLLWCSMLGRRYSPSFLQGTRPRFASDTLMSLRAIPSFSLGYLVLRQGIYAPLRVSVFGVRCGPAGVTVDARWFSVCVPCLANWGGGGLSRFGLLRGGWMFCMWGGGYRLLVSCEMASQSRAEGSVPSVATSGCPKRSEGGCPCRSEDVHRPSSGQRSGVWACESPPQP